MIKTEDAFPTWLHYIYLLPQDWLVDRESHGICKLFESSELEYWLINIINKKILNFHNHELSTSEKITSFIWFYNFCVQLLYTNYFLLILISNMCHLDGKVYTYHPNFRCWFWSSVTHFDVFMLELKYLWEHLPFQLQHRTDKIIFLNWLPSSQSL